MSTSTYSTWALALFVTILALGLPQQSFAGIATTKADVPAQESTSTSNGVFLTIGMLAAILICSIVGTYASAMGPSGAGLFFAMNILGFVFFLTAVVSALHVVYSLRTRPVAIAAKK